MRKRSEAKSRPQREIPKPEYDIDTPNDPVNEQVILAAMLVDQETCDRLLPILPPDAFYGDEHRALRDAIGEARRKQLALDPATLQRLVPDVDVRIPERLMASRPDVSDNIDFHVDLLLWDWRRARAAQGPIGAIVAALQDPKATRDKLRALGRQVADAFEGDSDRSTFIRDPKEVVRQTMTALRKRMAGEAHYPYGIDGLDYYENGKRRLRPGASPGTIALVSALSGSGKSTMMAHLTLGIAKQRRKVLFGAWEEEAPVTLELLTTLALEWSRSRVLDGKSNQLRTEDGDDWAPLTREDLITFEEMAHKISGWVSFFDNPFQINERGASPSNDDHLDIIEDHIRQSGCEVFFADLLHRAFVDDSPRAEKLALLRMLAITQREKVHTVAAHQQRAKDIETRVDKRPTREGIIGAGAWLDTPWVVMAPHLPAKWKNVDDNTLELYILKQRLGPWPLGIEFDWDPDTGQIRNGRSIDVKAQLDAAANDAFGSPSTKRGGAADKKKPSRAARAGFASSHRRAG